MKLEMEMEIFLYNMRQENTCFAVLRISNTQ